jgi:hypothetical protein
MKVLIKLFEKITHTSKKQHQTQRNW